MEQGKESHQSWGWHGAKATRTLDSNLYLLPWGLSLSEHEHLFNPLSYAAPKESPSLSYNWHRFLPGWRWCELHAAVLTVPLEGRQTNWYFTWFCPHVYQYFSKNSRLLENVHAACTSLQAWKLKSHLCCIRSYRVKVPHPTLNELFSFGCGRCVPCQEFLWAGRGPKCWFRWSRQIKQQNDFN